LCKPQNKEKKGSSGAIAVAGFKLEIGFVFMFFLPSLKMTYGMTCFHPWGTFSAPPRRQGLYVLEDSSDSI
jgi:hypothetical protein